MRMTPIQVRIGGYILVAVIILLSFFLWLNGRDNKLAMKQSAEQGVRTDKAVTGITQDAGQAQQQIAQDESSTNNARDDYQRGYEDAKRNDPAVAPWGARPIPNRLRELARQRRSLREQSGCAGAGCEHDDGAKRN